MATPRKTSAKTTAAKTTPAADDTSATDTPDVDTTETDETPAKDETPDVSATDADSAPLEAPDEDDEPEEKAAAPAPSSAPLDAPEQVKIVDAPAHGIRDSEVGIHSKYERQGIIEANTGKPVDEDDLDSLFETHSPTEVRVTRRLLEYRVFAGSRPAQVLLVAKGAVIGNDAAATLKARISDQAA